MTRELSRKFHAAKSQKRMSLPAPDYDPLPDYNRLAKRITIESFWLEGSEKHVLELYPAKGRKDQYRAVVDGRPWRDKISLSEVFASLRKSR